MTHLILLHSGNNEFYINADHISAIFPTTLKRDQGEIHGSKLILTTQASRIIVEEPPARILEQVNRINYEQLLTGYSRIRATEVPHASPEEYKQPF